MADQNVNIVITAIDRATGVVRRIGQSVDGLGRRQFGGRGIGARAGLGAGLGLGMGGVGGLAAIGAGAGAVGIVRAAADYESALTGIQKKSGWAADEVARLGEEAKALATSGEVAITFDEILAGMERGAAMGIPMDEMMDFISLTARASDAFEMSAEDVANASATIAEAFKIPRSEMELMFDVINSLADAGIAAEADIVNFMERSGASLNLFGQTREEAAALGATLLNLGMPAEVASRAMNTLTTRLLAPGSAPAMKAFKAIVGDVDEFQELLRTDANAALDQFLGYIAEMDKFESADLLTKFLGQGFSDEVIRLAQSRDLLQQNLDLVKDGGWRGSLDVAYQLKLDDFWSQWQVFQNQLSVMAIDIGGASMPTLINGLNGAMALAREMEAEWKRIMAEEVDWEGVEAAKSALITLSSEVQKLMGLNPEESGVAQMFDNIATTINTISAGIKQMDDFIKWADEASGEKARREQRERDNQSLLAQQAAGLVPEDRDFGILGKIREGGLADKVFDAIDQLGTHFGRPIRTDWGEPGLPKLPQSPADVRQSQFLTPGLFDPTSTATQMPELTFSAPDAINVGELQAEAAEAKAIIDNLSFQKANPMLTMEAAQFFQMGTQAHAMLDSLGRSVTARADLDISPILAKVAQARSAIAALESEAGSSYNSNVRSQFAPVGAG